VAQRLEEVLDTLPHVVLFLLGECGLVGPLRPVRLASHLPGHGRHGHPCVAQVVRPRLKQKDEECLVRLVELDLKRASVVVDPAQAAPARRPAWVSVACFLSR